MSIIGPGQAGNSLGASDPSVNRLDSHRARRHPVPDSGDAFAKLLEGLGQTTLPNTGAGAGATGPSSAAPDAATSWPRPHLAVGTRSVSASDLRTLLVQDPAGDAATSSPSRSYARPE